MGEMDLSLLGCIAAIKMLILPDQFIAFKVCLQGYQLWPLKTGRAYSMYELYS